MHVDQNSFPVIKVKFIHLRPRKNSKKITTTYCVF